ncbi:hypothetical protein GN958_ATG05774, partial [Phytophthora infestans]
QKIILEVADNSNVILELRTVQRVLNELDFHYVLGRKRHIMADTAAIASLRAYYIENKLANRRPTRRGELNPRITEVFLDESFGNDIHVAGKIWLLEDKSASIKVEKGLVAAGFISTKGGRGDAGFVEGSIKCWNATSKRKTWDEDDYHGNFDTEKFERWFLNLYGASYHKNITNRNPTLQSTRGGMRTWFTRRHVIFSLKETKAKLMECVTFLKEKPICLVQTIAAKYNHRVLYTPQYHPEALTDRAHNCQGPLKNANDAVEKVIVGLNAITVKEWVSVYRHAQGFEN